MNFRRARASREAIVFIPTYRGGISSYATEQARELGRRGWRVTVLSTSVIDTVCSEEPFEVERCLFHVSDKFVKKLNRRAIIAASIIANHAVLAFYAMRRKPDLILVDCYSEYLSLLWAWMHWLPRKLYGTIYAVTIHDPDRRKILGPKWLHRLSVRLGYVPYSVGLMHGLNEVAAEWRPGHLELRDVPHGVFTPLALSVQAGEENSTILRAELGIPTNATLVLAFGYVADRKNLDIAIQAMITSPSAHLLIAGRRASARDRPVDYYQNLAKEVGVTERVHFVDRYISEGEMPAFFAAADVILLAYKSEFVSQSGVLHLAANWSKPVLASSGTGPLKRAVEQYQLGKVVAPDSIVALAEGLEEVISGPLPEMGWGAFRRESSWERNIDQLLDAVSAAQAKGAT